MNEGQGSVKRGGGCLRWALYGIGGFVVLSILAAIFGGDEDSPGASDPTLIATFTPTAAAVTSATPVVVQQEAPAATDTPIVVDAADPTATPTQAIATPTPIPPTPIPAAPAQSGAIANTLANLRAGPGTTFEVAGSVAQGQALDVIGRNAAGDWLQLASGAWIFASLVDGVQAGIVVMAEPVLAAPVVPTPVSVAPVSNSDSQAFQCVGGCATPPNPACDIKGNVNSSGDSRIYHTTDSRFYSRTDIKFEEGDRWFCTISEAEAAGFRAPEN